MLMVQWALALMFRQPWAHGACDTRGVNCLVFVVASIVDGIILGLQLEDDPLKQK